MEISFKQASTNKENKMLVVTSKVKAAVKEKGYRTSKEFLEALSKKVDSLLDQAINAAISDGRKTVKPEDL